MKVSTTQVLILMDVCRHAMMLNLPDGTFGYPNGMLRKLYADLLNQQSNQLVDTEDQKDEQALREP